MPSPRKGGQKTVESVTWALINTSLLILMRKTGKRENKSLLAPLSLLEKGGNSIFKHTTNVHQGLQ